MCDSVSSEGNLALTSKSLRFLFLLYPKMILWSWRCLVVLVLAKMCQLFCIVSFRCVKPGWYVEIMKNVFSCSVCLEELRVFEIRVSLSCLLALMRDWSIISRGYSLLLKCLANSTACLSKSSSLVQILLNLRN